MSKKIFRTIVVAGAMLGTAHADAPPPGAPAPPPAKNAPVDQKSPTPNGDTKPVSPIDKAPAEKVPPSKDPAKPDKDKPVDKKAPAKKPTPPSGKKADAARPRGTDDRPVGRGFVLA